jgi:hypothetical protein
MCPTFPLSFQPSHLLLNGFNYLGHFNSHRVNKIQLLTVNSGALCDLSSPSSPFFHLLPFPRFSHIPSAHGVLSALSSPRTFAHAIPTDWRLTTSLANFMLLPSHKVDPTLCSQLPEFLWTQHHFYLYIPFCDHLINAYFLCQFYFQPTTVPTQTQQKAFTEHLSHPINPFECSSHAKTIILKQRRPQPQKNTHLRSLNPFTILSSYSSPVKPERIHIRLTKKKICSYDFSPRLVGW